MGGFLKGVNLAPQSGEMSIYAALALVRAGLVLAGLALWAMLRPDLPAGLAPLLAVGGIYAVTLLLFRLFAGYPVPWALTVIVDLAITCAMVWVLGGIVSDSYALFYLVIAGTALLRGGGATLAVTGFTLLAYTATVLLRSPHDPWTLALRLFVLAIFGLLAAFLAAVTRRYQAETLHKEAMLRDLREAHERLERYAAEMARQAITDGLTGLYNHAYLHRRLDEEVRRAERYGLSLSLIMLDLDGFKEYNDTFGHLQGNLVLRQVASILISTVRSVDIVARYGGEEFAIILPGTGHDAALAVAERIRQRVQDARFHAQHGRELTVSAGVAEYPRGALTKQELLELADQGLYRSKRLGKNRVASGTVP